MFILHSNHFLKEIRCPGIVRIQKSHILAATLLQSVIACRAYTLVVLRNDTNPFILLGAQPLECPIMRTVVDSNEFPVCERLIQNTAHTSGKVSLSVIAGHDYRNTRCHHKLTMPGGLPSFRDSFVVRIIHASISR